MQGLPINCQLSENTEGHPQLPKYPRDCWRNLRILEPYLLRILHLTHNQPPIKQTAL